MRTWDLLRTAWFILIGVLLAGYSVLDGLDLGLGVLFPFLAKGAEEKRELRGAIGPFWDGNEVWLLTGGGALFAAFPEAYATVFSGFYLALMLVLFALILRAVSLEFQAHARRGRGFWEKVFVAASAVPALLFGVALGSVVAGIPLDGRFEFTGNLFTLLRPLPVVFGLLGLAAFSLQGSVWAALKTSSGVQERARKAASKIALVFGALFLLALIMTAIYLPQDLRKPLAWVFSAVVILAVAGVRRAIGKKKDGSALWLSSAAFVGLWGIVGAIQFPNLVRASDAASSLTIHNASSSALTLRVMLLMALIGMPIVIGYTVFSYRVFKGKVRPGDLGY